MKYMCSCYESSPHGDFFVWNKSNTLRISINVYFEHPAGSAVTGGRCLRFLIRNIYLLSKITQCQSQSICIAYSTILWTHNIPQFLDEHYFPWPTVADHFPLDLSISVHHTANHKLMSVSSNYWSAALFVNNEPLKFFKNEKRKVHNYYF